MARKKIKKGEYQNVSKRMGLSRLEKATPKTCNERAALIERKLAKGEIPKSLHEKAKRWITTYRSRAKSLRAA